MDDRLLELVKILRSLLVFNESSPSEFARRLKGLEELAKEIISGNEPELLAEAVAAYIIERCDNMLANTGFNDKCRRYIIELANEAYKLYVLATLRRILRNTRCFSHYVIGPINEPIPVDAGDREELREKLLGKLENRGFVRKELNEKGIRLSRIAYITSSSELKESIDILSRALDENAITLVIMPKLDNGLNILFFKDYYWVDKTNGSKVRGDALAVREIIGKVKEYIRFDETIDKIIGRMQELLNKIIGSPPIIDYAMKLQEETPMSKELVYVSLRFPGRSFGFTIRYRDRVINEPASSFPELIKTLHSIGVRNVSNIENGLYSMICSARKGNQYSLTIAIEPDTGKIIDLTDYYRTVTRIIYNVISGGRVVEKLVIFNKVLLIKQPIITIKPKGDEIIVDVRKANGLIELTVNDRYVYQKIQVSELERIAHEIIDRFVLKLA